MKVLEKSFTQDGVKIQIEDWSEDYSFYPYASHIAAYPKTEAGYSYRASYLFESSQEAVEVFEKLKLGTASLDDFSFTSKKAGFDIPFRQFRFNY